MPPSEFRAQPLVFPHKAAYPTGGATRASIRACAVAYWEIRSHYVQLAGS